MSWSFWVIAMTFNQTGENEHQFYSMSRQNHNMTHYWMQTDTQHQTLSD